MSLEGWLRDHPSPDDVRLRVDAGDDGGAYRSRGARVEIGGGAWLWPVLVGVGLFGGLTVASVVALHTGAFVVGGVGAAGTSLSLARMRSQRVIIEGGHLALARRGWADRIPLDAIVGCELARNDQSVTEVIDLHVIAPARRELAWQGRDAEVRWIAALIGAAVHEVTGRPPTRMPPARR